jgi:glycosyltransferase involved in cell wall biosynthesis
MQNYDLIHVHAIFSYPSTIAMLIARAYRKPYVIRSIGQLSKWSLSQSKLRKKIMLSMIEKSNLSKAVAVHVTSMSEQNDVLRLKLGTPVLLLGLGVDYIENCDELLKTESRSCIKFLFLSRLHPKKQLEILMRALADLKDCYKHENWSLYIAGDGEQDYVLKLKSLAAELGIANRIVWMGHITGRVKEDLLKSVDWYVLPSASENFAISAVEAMAAGVPVIITNSVGVSDMVQKHGAGIIAEANTKELSQALHQAMNGPPLAMKQASRRLVKDHYLWSSVAKELTAFYSKVLH